MKKIHYHLDELENNCASLQDEIQHFFKLEEQFIREAGEKITGYHSDFADETLKLLMELETSFSPQLKKVLYQYQNNLHFATQTMKEVDQKLGKE